MRSTVFLDLCWLQLVILFLFIVCEVQHWKHISEIKPINYIIQLSNLPIFAYCSVKDLKNYNNFLPPF